MEIPKPLVPVFDVGDLPFDVSKTENRVGGQLAISTSHESIRIESLVEGAFACSHIHHTRVERNDCRRGCVGGSHTLMDGLIGHRVSG